MTQEIRTQIETFLANLSTDVDTSLINIDDLDLSNTDGIYDQIVEMLYDKGGFDIEIIYYSNAIKYLSENDPSLRESLELANDMGFDLAKLNSEILASIHASENARGQFSELQSEITEFFENLQEIN